MLDFGLGSDRHFERGHVLRTVYYNLHVQSILSLPPAWFYFDEAIYVVGERSGSLTIRIRRDGYRDDAIIVNVGKYADIRMSKPRVAM